MSSSRGSSAGRLAVIAAVLGAAAACDAPQLFCEGGEFEQTLMGRGCVFGPERVAPGGEPACPEHVPVGSRTTEGVVCTDSDPAVNTLCATVGRSRARACGLDDSFFGSSCIVALTFDSLECDGVVNLCGDQRLPIMPPAVVSPEIGCGGGLRFGLQPGDPAFESSAIVTDWPRLDRGMAAGGIELRVDVALVTAPPASDVEQGPYAAIFRQQQTGFTLGFARRGGTAQLFVSLGTCVGDSDQPARYALDGRTFPIGQPIPVRAGVNAIGEQFGAWLEWDGGRVEATPTGCVPRPPADAVGFTLGPFPGTLDALVLQATGGAATPPPPVMPPMPPPMCMPPMVCPP